MSGAGCDEACAELRAGASVRMPPASWEVTVTYDTDGLDDIAPEPMLISLDDVTTVHVEGEDGSTAALKGVSLGVRPGCFLAVMGGPGAGKTTLLRCLAGDVLPRSGSVHRGLGVVGVAAPAAEEDPWPGEQVRSYVERAAAHTEVGPSRLRDLYRATGLWEHRLAPAESLVPKFAPQLAVVRSLVRGAQLLLVDQPVAHGAAGSPEEWAEVLRRAVDRTGVAAVMVTADPAAAARADATVFLRDGLLVDALAGAAPQRIADCLKLVSLA